MIDIGPSVPLFFSDQPIHLAHVVQVTRQPVTPVSRPPRAHTHKHALTVRRSSILDFPGFVADYIVDLRPAARRIALVAPV